MPATLDDLYAVALAIQVDHRVQSDRLIDAVKGGGGGPPGPTGSSGGMADDLEKVSKAAGRAQTALTSFIGTFDKVISSLGGGMAKFVQLASPATVFRFNMAVENAMSAMGKVLVPVMEKFTLIVQQLGNAIESLSPEAKRAVGGLAAGGGLAGVLSALATAGMLVFRALGPVPAIVIALASAVAGVMTTTESGRAVMQSFGKVMESLGVVAETVTRTVLPVLEAVLVPAFNAAADAMRGTAEAVKILTNAARGLIGLDPVKYDPNAKTALANRPAQMGDLRGYASRAYVSSWNSQGTPDIAKAHLDEAKKQTSLIERMLDVRGGLEKGGRAVGGETGEGIGRKAGAFAELVAGPFLLGPRALARMGSALFD